MKPQSETELAEMIREANGPLRIVGGGTRPVGRPLDCAPLDVSSLAGITLHEPGALTLVAKAKYAKGAEMRPRLLALVHERLNEAEIQLAD